LRLLYVVTEDWYFLSHRLPMARAARDAGFEVHVAARVADGAAAIRAEGFVLHSVPFMRGRISPFGTIATIRALRDIHRNIAPDIVHHVALQATILGSIAAAGRPINGVNALTGLGYTFTSAAAYNEGRWKNAKFDGLLDQARSEMDAAKRTDLYKQAEQLLADDGGIIIPFFVTNVAVLRSECSGYEPNPQSVNREYDELTCKGKEAQQ